MRGFFQSSGKDHKDFPSHLHLHCAFSLPLSGLVEVRLCVFQESNCGPSGKNWSFLL